jgi:hypothetical protein
MSSISSISSNYYSYEQKNATSRTNSSFKSTLASALDKLVKAGTITDDQEEAISEALSPSDDSTSSSTSVLSSSQSDNPLKSALDSLVSAGTITNDQESSIAAALAPPDANSTGASSGTDTNSISFTDSDSDNPLKKALDSLVSSGTITNDQESAVAAALAPPSGDTLSGATSSSSGSSYLKDTLDTLVSSGTITDDQESAVTALLTGGNDVSVSSYNSLNSCFYSKLI